MVNQTSPIEPCEQKLEGRWIEADGKIVEDETAARIANLISTQLTKLATSADGWSVLYFDSRDGRKWELTYPHSEWHGGGPPTLTQVSNAYVQSKY